MKKNPAKKEIRFDLDLTLYGLESLKQAAAIWRKKIDVFVERKPKNKLEVALRFKPGADGVPAAEFLNEVLNQKYRQMVGRFNKKITEMIVVQALYSASRSGTKDAAAVLEPVVAAQREAEIKNLMDTAQREIVKKYSVRPQKEIPVPA